MNGPIAGIIPFSGRRPFGFKEISFSAILIKSRDSPWRPIVALLARVHPEMVDLVPRQGRTKVSTAGVAALR